VWDVTVCLSNHLEPIWLDMLCYGLFVVCCGVEYNIQYNNMEYCVLTCLVECYVMVCYVMLCNMMLCYVEVCHVVA